MDVRTPLELANDNAAGCWLAQAEAFGWRTRVAEGRYAAVRRVRDDGEIDQVLVVRPPADPAALRDELVALFRQWETRRLTLEDPYGLLDLSGYGCEAGLAMPVMTRQGEVAAGVGAAEPGAGAVGAEVREVTGTGELAVAEQTVVEGFPVPDRMPWSPGGLLPPRLLTVPGWRAWLARRAGVPAGACVTYDDGEAVGVYWVAVLPEHRSHGVGRALLDACLTPYRDRTAVLTATLLGEPLYRKAGFGEVSLARWWRYPGAPRG